MVTRVGPPELEPTSYEFEERAAIHEFDGGLPRAEAERLARMEQQRQEETSNGIETDEEE
jgi:hypothetical protein